MSGQKGLSRRQFLTWASVGLGSYVLYRWFRFPPRDANVRRPRRLGTTFSPLQCRYLGLDDVETFGAICSLGCDIVRLCSYWRDIEPREGFYTFESLDPFLSLAQKRGLTVVLTVGMKAPRWPEFHFPPWVEARYSPHDASRPLDRDVRLADRALRFVRKVVEHARTFSCVRYIQVENEPFSRVEVAGGRHLSPQFVAEEVALVRALAPGRKILLTTAINLWPLKRREDERAFRQTLALADAVGINVYTRVPLGPKFYLEPLPPYWRTLSRWRREIAASGKEPWIAESQAEPWEYGQLVATQKRVYPSSTPRRAVDLAVKLAQLGYGTVLLWGSEYWYWQKRHGYDGWWRAVRTLVTGVAHE